MARAYFIGGAPRVGKSTLARSVLSAHPMRFAATDDLRTLLRQTVTPDTHPALYHLDSLNSDEDNMARHMREQTEDIIAAADRESAIVWTTVEVFVRQHISAGRDVLVEGVAILPHLVAQLDFDYHVVYLGNQSPAHAGIIQKYAQTHPNSWLGTLHPDTVAAFAKFTQAVSAHIEQQATLAGLPYLEMSTETFETSLANARKLFCADGLQLQ